MNILINLATLKAGGGQNVGLNFLQSLNSVKRKNWNFHFISAKNTRIHKYLEKHQLGGFTIVPANPLKRILFELFCGQKIIKNNKIDIIYSYFGLGLYPKNTPQVIGSADSNLYFPEIDFWEQYKGLKRTKRRIVDNYRIWGIKRANGIIFENKILEERCQQIFKITNTTFIKPSINLNFETKVFKMPILNKSPKGLFLCGWQRNKNFILIPEIAAKLRELNQEFHFIITAPMDDSEDHILFNRLVNKYKVNDMISIVGQINKEELSSLYQQIDYVFLLSKLESFSNNIIEAWHFEKPLIISDELWAKSICLDGAIYVDRNSTAEIAKEIIELESNDNKKSNILYNARKILNTYPDILEKTNKELDYLSYIYENN